MQARAYLSGYHRAARDVCGLLSSAIKKRNSLFGSGAKGPRPLTLATGTRHGPHMEGANSIGQPVNEHNVLRIVNVRSLSPTPPTMHRQKSPHGTHMYGCKRMPCSRLAYINCGAINLAASIGLLKHADTYYTML